MTTDHRTRRSAARRAVARIYARLSRTTDESTSIDSQITSGAAFADAHEWDVTGPADGPAYVDDGVSGATALDKRDGMAALLADAQRGDKIVARSVDRFARSLVEFATLADIAKRRGLELWTYDGMISPQTIDIIAPILAVFAQFERQQTIARVVASKEALRTAGRWDGPAPYGYRVVRANGGAYLAEDPESGAIVRDLAERVTSGVRIGTLVRELNANGTLSPADYARRKAGKPVKGSKWTDSALRDLLASDTLTGTLLHDPRSQAEKTDANGKRVKLRARDLRPVIGDDGRPVKCTVDGTGILTDTQLARVREALTANGRGPVRERATDTELLHVAFCGTCGTALHANARKTRASSSYRCPNTACTARASIAANRLEPYVADRVISQIGHVRPLVVASVVADVSAELAATQAAYDSLAEALERAEGNARRTATLEARMTRVEARLDALETQQAHAGTRTMVPAETTIAEDWARAEDGSARRALLRSLDIRVTVRRGGRYDAVADRVDVTIPDALTGAAYDGDPDVSTPDTRGGADVRKLSRALAA